MGVSGSCGGDGRLTMGDGLRGALVYEEERSGRVMGGRFLKSGAMATTSRLFGCLAWCVCTQFMCYEFYVILSESVKVSPHVIELTSNLQSFCLTPGFENLKFIATKAPGSIRGPARGLGFSDSFSHLLTISELEDSLPDFSHGVRRLWR